MRRTLILAGKLIVSAALLYVALRVIDLDELLARFAKMDWGYAIAAVLVLLLQVVIAGLRWRAILASMALALPTKPALQITFIGAFFNQTLPSTIGGDAMRVWLAGRLTGAWRRTVYSVLLDRLMGLVGLLCIGLFAVLFLGGPLRGTEAVAIVSWVIAAGIAATVGFFLFDLVIGRRLPKIRGISSLNDLSAAARRLVTKREGALVWAASIAIQAMTVVAAWLISRSIGAPAPLGILFFLVPVVILVAMAPVSVAGWGLREGAMVTAFTLAGLNGSDAFAISVLLGLALLVVGAVGGLVWIASGLSRQIPPDVPPGDLNAQKETTG